MLFIITTLSMGAMVMYRYPSYSPLLMFCLGIAMFYINEVINHESIEFWKMISSNVIFRYLIPPLIYNSAFHIEYYILKQYINQILILIIPVLCFNIASMACLTKLLDKWVIGNYSSLVQVGELSWQLCLLFGTIISATDPVSVLAILEHQNMSQKVKTLIDGEALLNDAAVYLIFTLFIDYDYGTLAKIAYIPIGSIVLGCVSFAILFQILRKMYDSHVEIIITIIFCHGTFYVSELLQLSGIFSTVIVGLWMAYIGKTAISPSVKKSLEHVWETFDVSMNHIIFALSGLIGTRTIGLISTHWHKVLVLYLGTNIFRCMWIMLFKRWLICEKYRIKTKQLVLIGLSNIKGAITITLALQLTEIRDEGTEIVLFYTFAVTFLTLLINPIAIKYYIKYVIKHEYNEAVEYLLHIRDKMTVVGKEIKLNLITETDYMHNIDWSIVDQYIVWNNPEQRNIPIKPENNIHIEYRIIYLTSLKRSFWKLFDDHLLYRDTIVSLTEIIDTVLDTDDKHWISCFSKYCSFPTRLTWLPEWYKSRVLYHDINHRHNLLIGYIVGHQITLQHLSTVFEFNSSIIHELRLEQQESIKQAKEFLIEIEQKYPNITKKVETRQAIYHVLKKQQRYLKDFFKKGKINYYIYNHINQEIKQTLYEKARFHH